MNANAISKGSREDEHVAAELAELISSWTDDDHVAIFGEPNPDGDALRMMRADEAFLREASIEAAFPGRWVAGHNRAVVADAATLMELRDTLRANGTWTSPKAIRRMPAA